MHTPVNSMIDRIQYERFREWVLPLNCKVNVISEQGAPEP